MGRAQAGVRESLGTPENYRQKTCGSCLRLILVGVVEGVRVDGVLDGVGVVRGSEDLVVGESDSGCGSGCGSGWGDVLLAFGSTAQTSC